VPIGYEHPTMTTETLFTRIINRDIPADILYEDDQCINNGADAGQTIFHLHLHILANKGSDKKFSEANL
jgi:diadenosine tetraphosphate (Ap4A) HIT family hydrolase